MSPCCECRFGRGIHKRHHEAPFHHVSIDGLDLVAISLVGFAGFCFALFVSRRPFLLMESRSVQKVFAALDVQLHKVVIIFTSCLLFNECSRLVVGFFEVVSLWRTSVRSLWNICSKSLEHIVCLDGPPVDAFHDLQ